MNNSVSKYLLALQHLFFPHYCAGCGADFIRTDEFLCPKCNHQLPYTRFLELRQNPVEKIFSGRLQIEAGGALCYFTKSGLLQHILVQLKYRNNKNAGYFLGRLLGHALKRTERYQSIDLIIPMPLHPKKEYQRGYNQATVIGEGIRSVWNKPIISDAVIRLVYTRSQTRENRSSRWENMEGVFRVILPNLLLNKHILLIDDVVTTGSSLEACGDAILEIPGTRLSIATVAYTI
jgi:ComF family protein